MSVSAWMSWEGGVDLLAMTDPSFTVPNVIVHVARLVHTPNGSSASGMVFYMPDPTQPPLVMGFVSHDEIIGEYFGPNIFAGTPFENAPVIPARIEVFTDLPHRAGAKVTFNQWTFETELMGLGALQHVNRLPNDFMPFSQQGVEAAAAHATLKVNGADVPIVLPPAEALGAPAAAWATAGIYSR